MSFDDDFLRHMENIDEAHKRMDEEFHRLCCDPSMKTPKVGDFVVVATGFLGMGHLWVREEAEVIEVGDTSYKVRLVNYKYFGKEKGTHMVWVHSALITDVLERNQS